MNRRAKVGLGIGASVIALGAAVGVGAFAANLAGSGGDGATSGYGRDGGGGARGGMDTTRLAATLAGELGVDQAKVEAALQDVMSANRPSGARTARPSGEPTAQPSERPDADRSGFLQSMAKALAEKLDLDEAKVLAALQEAVQNQGGGSTQPSAEPTR